VVGTGVVATDVCCFRWARISAAATTAIYTLSLHDALPILLGVQPGGGFVQQQHPGLLGQRPGQHCALPFSPGEGVQRAVGQVNTDRKSTRLNSSHVKISYAVFCLKKKAVDQLPPRAYSAHA